MIVFPQLTTGAVGQFPIVRKRKYNAVTNLLADGSAVAYTDSSPRTNSWELTLRDLTDAEAASLEQLFQAVEGRRGTFTFLDPTANLLAHSEELDNACWIKGPMIQLSAGIDDPLGGDRAIRLINAGQTMQTLSQSLPAPAWFAYCFSAYARSAGGSSVLLTRSGSANSQTAMVSVSTSGATRFPATAARASAKSSSC